MRPGTVHVVDDRDKQTRGDIRPDASGSTINGERGNVIAKKAGAFEVIANASLYEVTNVVLRTRILTH